MREIDSWWEAAAQHREPSSVLCGDLEGGDGEGVGRRLKNKGINVCIQLIHFIVQQKLTTL